MQIDSIDPLHDRRVEACRGVALISMIVAHWPVGIVSHWLTIWTGFVGPDEVFVMVSGFIAGSFYGPRQEIQNKSSVFNLILLRCLQIWAINLLRTILINTIHAYRAYRFTGVPFVEAFSLDYFIQNPSQEILKLFSFQYQADSLGLFPVFFFIYLTLPIFLFITQKNRLLTILISLFFYITGQFFQEVIYSDLESGKWFYNLLTWQFPFFIGLCFGYPREYRRSLLPSPHIIAAFSSVILLLCFMLKLILVLFPQTELSLDPIINHSNLGILRLINLVAYFLVFARLLKEQTVFFQSIPGKIIVLCGQYPTTLFMLAIILGLLIDFLVISAGIWYLPHLGTESLVITIPCIAALLNSVEPKASRQSGLSITGRTRW